MLVAPLNKYGTVDNWKEALFIWPLIIPRNVVSAKYTQKSSSYKAQEIISVYYYRDWQWVSLCFSLMFCISSFNIWIFHKRYNTLHLQNTLPSKLSAYFLSLDVLKLFFCTVYYLLVISLIFWRKDWDIAINLVCNQRKYYLHESAKKFGTCSARAWIIKKWLCLNRHKYQLSI